MQNNRYHGLSTYKFRCIVPLFLPWIFVTFISYNPIASFSIAWMSTFFIFIYSIYGPLSHIGSGLSLKSQIMRPIILIQLVFAGLMSASSIFYFMNHLGYFFLSNYQTDGFKVREETFQLAACQRLYLFAHASLVFGMILKLELRTVPRYTFVHHPDHYLIQALLITTIAIACLEGTGALSQFAIILNPLPKLLAALILVKGLMNKHPIWILTGLTVFLYSLYQSSQTGYKEGIFVHTIMLGFISYPYFKQLILGLSLPIMLTLLYLLPTWNNTIRSETWTAESTIEQAMDHAYDQILDDEYQDLLKQNSWDFLTNRFSEINMFSKYVEHVPDKRPYYGTAILKNAMYALIPRFLWPEKPNTEETSMERVYDAEVVSPYSNVSAKTRPVVDGYLSAGMLGIFITMSLYGVICQWLSNLAEALFGGYQIGCIIVFNGMFQQLWRGNNIEFIINNIFYGYILMMATFYVLRYAGILTKNQSFSSI